MQEVVLSGDEQNIKCDLNGFEEWLKNKGRSNNCIDTYVCGIEFFYKKYKGRHRYMYFSQLVDKEDGNCFDDNLLELSYKEYYDT